MNKEWNRGECASYLAVKALGQSIWTGAWKRRAHTSQYVRNKENLWSGDGENCNGIVSLSQVRSESVG